MVTLQNVSEKSDMNFYIKIVVLIIFALLVRLFHYTPYLDGDEQRWIYAAELLLRKDVPNIPAVYHSRVLFSFLLAGWASFFSWSWCSLKVLLFLLSGATIASVVFAAKYYYGRGAAIFAGIFYAFHPINIMYDTAIIPDTLAVFVSAVAMLAFGHYLRTKATASIYLTGVTTGLLFSVKGYFLLYALPFLLVVIFFCQKGERLRSFLLLSAALVVGILISFVCLAIAGLISKGDILAAAEVYAGYGNAILSVKPDSSMYFGPKMWFHFAVERLEYLDALFDQYGQGVGLISLFAILYVSLYVKRCHSSFLVISLVLTALLFLFIQPDALIADRYLTILLAPLSIGAGYSLEQLWSRMQQKKELKFTGIILFVVAMLFAAWEPNNHWDRYRILEFNGIAEAQDIALKQNINSIAVFREASLQFGIPETLLRGKVPIVPITMQENDANLSVEFLKAEPGRRAIFIPRLKIKQMVNQIYGSSNIQQVPDYLQNTVLALNKAGARQIPVAVPYTSFRVRMDELGIKTTGELVGWIYVINNTSG